MGGSLDLALSRYRQAIAWSMNHAHPVLLAGSLSMGMADILRERNQLDGAVECATRGRRLAADLGAARAERWIEWQACDLLVLARIKQAQGDLDRALALVSEAQATLTGYGAVSFAALLAAFEAQLRLAKGDLAAAGSWLRSTQAGAPPHRLGLTPHYFVYAGEHLAMAPMQVLIAQGRASSDPMPVRRALTLLDHQVEEATRLGLVWRQCKAHVLQALAYQELGELAQALAALDQALALAEPEGYVRVFADEGQPMATLLRWRPAHGHGAPVVMAVRAALEGQSSPDARVTVQPPALVPAGTPAVALLTERETDVLRLVTAGLSNREIAHALYIEVNTVKTHLKSLYGKLNVHSRLQVVRRSRELRLP
jgi:ATP/maltotriose-dependent transcriptional regulator MalT